MDWRGGTSSIGGGTSSAGSGTSSISSSQKLPSSSSGLSSASSSSASSSESRWMNRHHHHHHSNHRRQVDRDEVDRLRYRTHESRSTDRHNYSSARLQQLDQLVGAGHDVVKSKSSSSVDAWAEEARAASERRATSSSRCAERETEPHGYSTIHGNDFLPAGMVFFCFSWKFISCQTYFNCFE